MKQYNHKDSILIEDQALNFHIHTLKQGANASPFESVLKIAEVYAMNHQAFLDIWDDKKELQTIANNVAKRVQIQRDSIHGKLYHGQHDHLLSK